jgi:branched-chain amino acid transport system permease protein
MTSEASRDATPARRFPPALPAELAGAAAIATLGAIGYVVFPDDLALLTRIVSIAFLVLALDLVTGYCGIATLGHAALFGVPAYAAGLACIGGLTDPVALLGVGMTTGFAAGLLSGALVARFHGLPQLVLSIALGQLVHALANKLSFLTGGTDGLSAIAPSRLFGLFGFDLWGRTGYGLAVGVLVVTVAALTRLARSPFGLTCRAIKDDPLRVRSLGGATSPPLVVMYGISGAVAGLGGALSAVTVGVVGVDSVSFERSAEALVMLALGGAGNLWGALVGTFLFQIFEHIVAAANPFQWMTLVGLLLMGVVIAVPRGLTRTVADAARGIFDRGVTR